MKPVPSLLQAHLAGELLTLARLVRLSRRDGLVLGFTDHDRPLTYAGTTYAASSAVIPKTLEKTSSLAVDQSEVEGFLSDGGLRDADLRAGLWDGAAIDVFLVNWSDLAQGHVHLQRGYIGRVEWSEDRYRVEVLGLVEMLQKTIGVSATRNCRVRLGSAACGVAVEAMGVNTSVLTVLDERTMTVSVSGNLGVADWAKYGRLRLTSGVNAGREKEIQAHAANGRIVLWEPFSEPIAPGTTARILPGCDRKASTCQAKFGNIQNFRGFPFIPGSDEISQQAPLKA